jgi:nitroimidazol reductase NimA-like FMN-containing flavoprotein (pyridoxamine 5'-phosphate oxidase superfamily)
MAKPLPDRIKQYIGGAPVGRIATVRPGGEPHVIPVCPVFDGDATLYVDLAPGSVSGRNVLANPRVTVLIDDYFDDWSKLRKVVLRCRARPVEGPEQNAAWERIRAKFPQYTSVDWQPRLTVALHIEGWLQEGLDS